MWQENFPLRRRDRAWREDIAERRVAEGHPTRGWGRTIGRLGLAVTVLGVALLGVVGYAGSAGIALDAGWYGLAATCGARSMDAIGCGVLLWLLGAFLSLGGAARQTRQRNSSRL